MNNVTTTLSLLILSLTTFSSTQAQTTAVDYRTVRNLCYRTAENTTAEQLQHCQLDLYYPAYLTDYATVVWFHGGGLTGGKRSIPQRLQDQGLAVAAVDYRLSPQVKAVDCVDDAAASVAWVFNHIAEYGGSNQKIFVSGHSAGGYLTSMIGLDKHYLQHYAIDADQIAGLIPFSGHAITHFTVRKEQRIPDTQPVIDAMAPLFHVRSDAPPLLLITGDRELEMLGRYEENAYLARMMKVVGHPHTTLYELDGFNHGGMADPAFPLLVNFVKELSQDP